MKYWEECLAIAADECGVTLTDEQLAYLADAVAGGHENYSQAHGYDVIGNPIEVQSKNELRELRRQIEQREQWEIATKPCRSCTTTGVVRDGWGRDVTCPDCGGKGRS